MELSAFVSWRRLQPLRSSKKSLLRKWELLDCDDKAKWIPQDHRTVLANDKTWAPLLSDGPPGEAKADDEEVVQDEERKGGEKKEKKKEPTRGKKRKSEQVSAEEKERNPEEKAALQDLPNNEGKKKTSITNAITNAITKWYH